MFKVNYLSTVVPNHRSHTQSLCVSMPKFRTEVIKKKGQTRTWFTKLEGHVVKGVSHLFLPLYQPCLIYGKTIKILVLHKKLIRDSTRVSYKFYF